MINRHVEGPHDGVIQEGLLAENAPNAYCASMGRILDEKFTNKWEPNNFLTALGETGIELNFSFVTEAAVLDNTLKVLPINKSSGVDNLSSVVMETGWNAAYDYRDNLSYQ